MPVNIADPAGIIQGVLLRECRPFPDDRGSFREVFRREWTPGCNYASEIQINLSTTLKGALRGLHFHREQHDWWVPVKGTFQAALADLRPGSSTFMNKAVFRLSAEDSVCLLVPPGVAHGFLALSDMTLMYAVDRYYDGSDEQGVTWNDPRLAIPWKTSEPVLSQRDMKNPTVEELMEKGLLPGNRRGI